MAAERVFWSRTEAVLPARPAEQDFHLQNRFCPRTAVLVLITSRLSSRPFWEAQPVVHDAPHHWWKESGAYVVHRTERPTVH